MTEQPVARQSTTGHPGAALTDTAPPAPALLLVLVRLLAGTDRAAYERFTAKVDRPGVLKHYHSVQSWHLYRLERTAGLPYDYLEIAEVSDLTQLDRDMAGDAATDLVRQAREFIEEPTVLISRLVV